MRKVLVVGGAGYIGSHCASLLSDQGILPIVFDNLSCGHRKAVKFGPLVVGDLLDCDSLTNVLKREKPDAVFHLAALALVEESLQKPELYRRNNVEGTRCLLRAMQAAGVEQLVFSSTCAVYGIPDRSPIDETLPCRPINPYGETKLAAEALLQEAARLHGIRSVSLRYFNAAGALPEQGIGEAHRVETHLIPLVLQSALGRGATLVVHGADYPTADGTAVRDYVHVADLARAHLAALDYLSSKGETLALNLGTGRGASVLEVIRTAEEVLGRPVPHSFGPRRPGDPAELVASARKAEGMLGWRPHYDLHRMVSDAWLWHQKQSFGLI